MFLSNLKLIISLWNCRCCSANFGWDFIEHRSCGSDSSSIFRFIRGRGRNRFLLNRNHGRSRRGGSLPSSKIVGTRSRISGSSSSGRMSSSIRLVLFGARWRLGGRRRRPRVSFGNGSRSPIHSRVSLNDVRRFRERRVARSTLHFAFLKGEKKINFFLQVPFLKVLLKIAFVFYGNFKRVEVILGLNRW